MRKKSNGFTMAFALVIAVASAILILALSQLIRTNANNAVYFSRLMQANQLANSGTNLALGTLTLDMSQFLDKTVHKDFFGQKYEIQVTRRNFDDVNGFYVVTTATQMVNGQPYVVRLHTYARVSNVSDYFTVVNDHVVVSFPVQAAMGRLYSSGNITFMTDVKVGSTPPPAGSHTQLLSAEYVDPQDGTPSPGRIIYEDPKTPALEDGWPDRANIQIGEAPDFNDGTKLKTPIIFPQVLKEDMDFYKEKATVSGSQGHFICEFSMNTYNLAGDSAPVQIFPPGYSGARIASDHYASDPPPTGSSRYVPYTNMTLSYHTNNNNDHVYYCEGDMLIEGTIHGQILFVASGDIHISSSLVNSTDIGELNSMAGGTPDLSASSAHQAILITPKNVIIDNTYLLPDVVLTKVSQEKIQAMVYAPQGSFYPAAYADPRNHEMLSLNFEGSMVLATFNASVNLPDVFQASRNYGYMLSLRTNPPPYMPSIVDIYHVFEEVVATGDAPN